MFWVSENLVFQSSEDCLDGVTFATRKVTAEFGWELLKTNVDALPYNRNL